jgi:hypothetical protein
MIILHNFLNEQQLIIATLSAQEKAETGPSLND